MGEKVHHLVNKVLILFSKKYRLMYQYVIGIYFFIIIIIRMHR